VNPQAGTSLHTIRNATPQDAALFGSLWIELLESHQEYGGDILPTERTMAYFRGVFQAYTEEERQGVVLFGARNNAVLMWGELESDFPYDHPWGRWAMGWGVYVRPDFRKQGISSALRQRGANELSLMDFETILGGLATGNSPARESIIQFGGTIFGEQVAVRVEDVADFQWAGDQE